MRSTGQLVFPLPTSSPGPEAERPAELAGAPPVASDVPSGLGALPLPLVPFISGETWPEKHGGALGEMGEQAQELSLP